MKQWRPVKDGAYPTLTVEGNGCVVRQSLSNIVLPNSNIRLCELVDVPAVVQPERIEAIKLVLDRIQSDMALDRIDKYSAVASAQALLRAMLTELEATA